jgi:hypothetical protein
MSKKLLNAGLLAGLMVGLMAPAFAHADGVSLNVNLGADDEAHFHFADRHMHHKPEIFKAATKLQAAKHDLWMAKNDFGGHKVAAIQAINQALDELRQAEEFRADH